MDDHPKGKKQLPKERTPRLVSVVDGVGDPGNNPHQVDDEEGCWRNEESRPFEHVELGEITFFIWGLRGDSEVCVNAGQHFEQTLEDGKEMGRDTTNDPKLLVSPPLVDPNPTPSHLKDTSRKDGEKEGDEPYTCNVANLLSQALSS